MLGVFKVNDKLGKRLVIILKGFPCPWKDAVFVPSP